MPKDAFVFINTCAASALMALISARLGRGTDKAMRRDVDESRRGTKCKAGGGGGGAGFAA